MVNRGLVLLVAKPGRPFLDFLYTWSHLCEAGFIQSVFERLLALWETLEMVSSVLECMIQNVSRIDVGVVRHKRHRSISRTCVTLSLALQTACYRSNRLMEEHQNTSSRSHEHISSWAWLPQFIAGISFRLGLQSLRDTFSCGDNPISAAGFVRHLRLQTSVNKPEYPDM
jgi:hypothetical protein